MHHRGRGRHHASKPGSTFSTFSSPQTDTSSLHNLLLLCWPTRFYCSRYPCRPSYTYNYCAPDPYVHLFRPDFVLLSLLLDCFGGGPDHAMEPHVPSKPQTLPTKLPPLAAADGQLVAAPDSFASTVTEQPILHPMSSIYTSIVDPGTYLEVDWGDWGGVTP